MLGIEVLSTGAGNLIAATQERADEVAQPPCAPSCPPKTPARTIAAVRIV
jgi:hypothetical protein